MASRTARPTSLNHDPSTIGSQRLDEASLSAQESRLLARFRGLAGKTSPGSLSRTKPVSDPIRKIVRRWNLGELSTPQQTIIQNWKKIVGLERAALCQPLRIVDGSRLIMVVGNPTLRQELEFDKRKILRRIRALPSCENIRHLQIRIA